MKNISIVATTNEKIKSYRSEYFKSLPEFQELFIELMVNDSRYYLISTEGKGIGYAICDDKGVLLEFYVEPKFIPESNIIFNLILKELSISEIYCKTFDSLLLSNCMQNMFSYSMLGVLYRDFIEARVVKDLQIQMTKVDLSFKELLLKQDNSLKELYETEQLLTHFIETENVFIFYKNNDLFGVGMVIKTHPDWGFCDLGVWVKPENRGCSLGAQILIKLREFSLNNNLNPSCGCAFENLASQKTIEKSGFVSRYKMVSFKTQ